MKSYLKGIKLTAVVPGLITPNGAVYERNSNGALVKVRDKENHNRKMKELRRESAKLDANVVAVINGNS